MEFVARTEYSHLHLNGGWDRETAEHFVELFSGKSMARFEKQTDIIELYIGPTRADEIVYPWEMTIRPRVGMWMLVATRRKGKYV